MLQEMCDFKLHCTIRFEIIDLFFLHWIRFENNCSQTKLRINFYIAANEANKQSKRRPKIDNAKNIGLFGLFFSFGA